MARIHPGLGCLALMRSAIIDTASSNLPFSFLFQLQENSVLDLLVSASEGGGEGKTLGDDEIISNCLIFLFAAYDTTSLTLTCASHLLATNPHIQDKLCSLLDHYWDKHKVKLKISTTVITLTLLQSTYTRK